MLTLTMKEQQRLEVIQGVMDGKIEMKDAIRLLDRSERQIYRMLSGVRNEGAIGIKHKLCGKSNIRRISAGFWNKIEKLITEKYKDINDLHLKEILERNEKIKVGRESLRRFLRSKGIKPKKKHRAKKYRSRRARKEALGMMLQLDASTHDWLEGRGEEMALLGSIDDATGIVFAHFEDAESTWGYLNLMEQVIGKHGLPLSLYSDRHTIFHSPREQTVLEQLQGKRPMTQFGRAMEELGIFLLKAWSAPAKGRIERLWGTLQDRLIVEMRLAGIKTKKEANFFLPGFLKDFNQRFSVKPKNSNSCFRKAPPSEVLRRILCLKSTRTVGKDHTVSFEGLPLQIPPSKKWASIAGQKVCVIQLNDGSIEVIYKRKTVAKFNPESVIRIMEKYKNEVFQLKRAA